MTPSPPPRGLHPILIVVGAATLSLTLCCGGCGLLTYFGVQRGQAQDLDAKAFVRTALQATGKAWSAEAFQPYAAPTWTSAISTEQTRRVFAKYDRFLGPLQSLGEPTTQTFGFTSQSGESAATRVTMAVPATFAKAKGTIRVGVAKIEGRWGVERLDVDSSALPK